MGEKRAYILKNQRLIYGRKNFYRLLCCMILTILVIGGVIALTVFVMKSSKSSSEETQKDLLSASYRAVGVTNQQTDEKLEKPGVTTYYMSTITQTDKSTRKSNLTDYTSTSIESPIYTSTIPSMYDPRFLLYDLDTTKSDDSESTSTIEKQRSAKRIVKFNKYYFRRRATTESTSFENSPRTLLAKETSTDVNSFPSTDSQSPIEKKCVTNLCRQSGGRMLGLMNHNVDPCEDFYSYACGGLAINHEILEAMPDISTLNLQIPHKKIYHDFFISCMNYKNGNGLKEASKFLYDLCQSNVDDDLTKLIADILMFHPQKVMSRILPLFDVTLEIEPNKNFIPILSLPKLILPLLEDTEMGAYERDCLNSIKITTHSKHNKSMIQQSYKDCLQNHTLYFKNLERSILLLQIFEHLSEFKKIQMIQKTLEFIDMNIVSEFGFISEEEINSDNKETVALIWLCEEYPEINWNKLFMRLFGEEIGNTVSEVQMRHTNYLVKILDFYRVNKFEDIKTSLLSMLAHDMYMDFIEPETTCDRYKYCQKIGLNLMPDIASKLYLESEPTNIFVAEKKIKTLFSQLIQKYNETINKNSLMSLDEKVTASKMISGLNILCNPYVAISDFEKIFNERYDKVNISLNDYVSNVLRLKYTTRRRMYRTYGKPAESLAVVWNYLVWPISSAISRITETNTIVIPTSIIRKLLKSGEKQIFEAFATAGFLISHQISSILYDVLATNVVFNPNNSYWEKPNIFGLELNEEDISASKISRFADDLSLDITLDAYMTHVTSDKTFPWSDFPVSEIFYILVGQQFCTTKKSSIEMAVRLIENQNLPHYFRINSMMMNSEKFLNTFECHF